MSNAFLTSLRNDTNCEGCGRDLVTGDVVWSQIKSKTEQGQPRSVFISYCSDCGDPKFKGKPAQEAPGGPGPQVEQAPAAPAIQIPKGQPLVNRATRRMLKAMTRTKQPYVKIGFPKK